MLYSEPDAPFRRHKARRGERVIWALRMPDDFDITVDRGRVDQRKAGAKHIVHYVQHLRGKAGDYLVVDPADGRRWVLQGETFDLLFQEAPESEDQH